MAAKRRLYLNETEFGGTHSCTTNLGGTLVLFFFLLFFHWAKRNVISVGTHVSFAHSTVVMWGFVPPK